MPIAVRVEPSRLKRIEVEILPAEWQDYIVY